MSEDRKPAELAILSWGPGFALAVATACALAQLLPDPGGIAGTRALYRWITHANTVLAGAAAVYAAYYWLGNERVGQAASLLAALGALGVPLALLADAAQVAPPRGAAAGFGLYEGTALFSALAVFVHLAMERAYGSRAAAFLVMPAVLLAVLCEMWLLAQHPDGLWSVLLPYWAIGQRVAACIGFAALAAGAAFGACVLLRPVSSLAGASCRAEAIVGSAAIGAPMLLVGTGMGAAWSVGAQALGSGAAATLPGLVAVTAFLLWVRRGGGDLRRLARNAIAAFAIATATFCVLPWPGASA